MKYENGIAALRLLLTVAIIITLICVLIVNVDAEEWPTAVPDYRTVNVQANSYLNFRELPSRAAPVIFTLSSGSRVRVLEERNGWSLCVWETLEGLTNPPKAWAKSEYLTK